MSSGAWIMALVTAITAGSLMSLIWSMIRGIVDHRSGGRSVWREFGLGLALTILFFTTWVGQGISQWQVFTDEARQHGEPVTAGDFFAEFAQSTLENWQSEFLQLFAFVVLAALYIHKGSAESKDGTEKLEASLRRLEEHLGTLPPTAPSDRPHSWMLPDTPLDLDDATTNSAR